MQPSNPKCSPVFRGKLIVVERKMLGWPGINRISRNYFPSVEVQVRVGFQLFSRFLKIFLHSYSMRNILLSLQAYRSSVRIMPGAFLVFKFRQHEIWQTLVCTKEQQQPFARDRLALQRLFDWWLCFLLPTYSLQLTAQKTSNSHFILCDFSKLLLKFLWHLGRKVGQRWGLAVLYAPA